MTVLENSDKIESYLEAIELTCRCFEVLEDWQSYIELINSNLADKAILFVDQAELAERLIKVCILPSFKLIDQENTNVGPRILKIISELPESTRAPNMAYNFLKTRIEERVFPYRFLEALDNIEDILDDIEENGMLTRWKGFESISNKSLLNKVNTNLENKGFNFLATLEALNLFISRSYIECILLDGWNNFTHLSFLIYSFIFFTNWILIFSLKQNFFKIRYLTKLSFLERRKDHL